MTASRHRIRQQLRSRGVTKGISLDYNSMVLAQQLGRGGFDLVFIDCEHGGPDCERIKEIVIAVESTPAVTVLRPWSRDVGLLRSYLDCHIDGLIVPDIESAADVAATRRVIEECAPPGAEDVIVIGLIESQKGVENLGEILACDGLDAVLIGPADMAVSMGLPRRGNDPKVQELALSVVSRAKAQGISSGGPVARYGLELLVGAGANLLMYTARDLMNDGIRAAHSAVRANSN